MSDISAAHLKFLGTASAVPSPTFECLCFNCEEARSKPNRRRTRSSIAVVGKEVSLVDAGPDLEQQMEREGLHRIDRLFITHWHTDHIAGLGGLGMHQTIGKWPPIKLYLPSELVPIFTAQHGYQLSSFEIHPIQPGDEVQTPDARWEVVKTNHSQGSVGFLIHSGRSVAYLCDGITPPPATIDRLRHSDVLVLEATMDECEVTDPAHFTAQQAAEFWSKSGVDTCLLTHASFHSRIAGQWAAGWSAEGREEFTRRWGLKYAVDGLTLPLTGPPQIAQDSSTDSSHLAYGVLLAQMCEANPVLNIVALDLLCQTHDGTVMGRAKLAAGARLPFRGTHVFTKGNWYSPEGKECTIVDCIGVHEFFGDLRGEVVLQGGAVVDFCNGVFEHIEQKTHPRNGWPD